jgi:hypothetical protein
MFYVALVIKNVWYWCINRHMYHYNKIKKPWEEHTIITDWFFYNGAKAFQGKCIYCLLKNDARIIEYGKWINKGST